eukprot:10279523-Lingulodinium_polyedra.AAC.1
MAEDEKLPTGTRLRCESAARCVAVPWPCVWPPRGHCTARRVPSRGHRVAANIIPTRAVFRA